MPTVLLPDVLCATPRRSGIDDNRDPKIKTVSKSGSRGSKWTRTTDLYDVNVAL